MHSQSFLAPPQSSSFFTWHLIWAVWFGLQYEGDNENVDLEGLEEETVHVDIVWLLIEVVRRFTWALFAIIALSYLVPSQWTQRLVSIMYRVRVGSHGCKPYSLIEFYQFVLSKVILSLWLKARLTMEAESLGCLGKHEQMHSTQLFLT